MPNVPKSPDRWQRRNRDTKAARGAELMAAAEGGEPVEVPEPRDWWTDDVSEVWPAWWQSDAAGVWRDADRLLVYRLADRLARAELLERESDTEPFIAGSTGQTVVHPGYRQAQALLAEARLLEKELGLTPAARLSMGLAAQTERARSLEQMARQAILRAVPADPRLAAAD